MRKSVKKWVKRAQKYQHFVANGQIDVARHYLARFKGKEGKLLAKVVV